MCRALGKEDCGGFSLAGYTHIRRKEDGTRPGAEPPDLSFCGCSSPPVTQGCEWVPKVCSLKPLEPLRGNKGQHDNRKHLQKCFPVVFTVFSTGDCRMAPWAKSNLQVCFVWPALHLNFFPPKLIVNIENQKIWNETQILASNFKTSEDLTHWA